MKRVIRLLSVALVASIPAASLPAFAQDQTNTKSVAQDDPNDKVAHDRSFEETRQHMQSHSEWSKQTGKMNDN